MKNVSIKYLLASIVVLGCFAGCAKERDVNPKDPAFSDEPIVMRAVTSGNEIVPANESAATKASVDFFRNTPVRFANCYVGMDDFGNPAIDTMNFTTHWDARIGVQGHVVFIPQRTYKADSSYHYLRGFHPRPTAVPLEPANPAGPSPEHCNVEYVLTGQEDIMVSTMTMVGNIEPENKRLDTYVIFNHLLTQFTFKIVNNQEAPFPGHNKIKQIWVETADGDNPLRYRAVLDLKTAKLEFVGSGPDSGGKMYAFNSPTIQGGLSVNASDKDYDVCVMFEPGKDVVIWIEYGDEESTTFKSFEAKKTPQVGISYAMKLNFSGVGLQLTYGIQPWQTVTISGEEGISTSKPIITW